MLTRPVKLLILVLLAWSAVADAAMRPFIVRDMRVEGLQRIAEGTVYNYLPITVGDTVDETRVEEAVRVIYGTGFFEDIEMRREGDTLIIAVRERPSIKAFTITGNKDIKTEDLEESLRGVGLAAGKSFDQSVLENVRQALTDQYFARGKYSVVIDTDVTELPDNTVRIAIAITEGKRASIRQINVVGNERYKDKEILAAFKLKEPNFLCFYRQDCRYDRNTLVGDLETLQSFYMDRGFANFDVVSTQVAISPDKQSIFITINVEEGDPYVISDVRLAGDLVVPEAQLESLVMVKPGQTFSRQLLTQTAELISYRLGQEGFAFARINPVPEIDDETNEVGITFYVDPGKRAYVRRISFTGTTGVEDEVFRREMRQLEGAFLSNRAVERSEQRLRRLPFIEEVETETAPVPGSDDLVDVNFTLTEGMPGSFGGGIGYSGSQGLILNGNFVHTNFLGSGNRIEADINGSEFSTVYRFSHTNPYVTPDGVSRTTSLSYRDITQFTSGASDFSTETWTGQLEYGYPISEFSRIRFGVAVQDAELSANQNSPLQAQDWVRNNGNSSVQTFELENGEVVEFLKTDFKSWEILAGWTYDSRNRVLFGDRGMRQRVAVTFTGPGSEVEFYTIRYDWLKYLGINPYLTFQWNGELSWSEDLGSTTDVPPYKNYFAGGPTSVRGYRDGRLGPRDTRGNPYGGNLKIASQMELLLPTPERLGNTTRFSLFYDVGNVFSTGSTRFFDQNGQPTDYDFELSELRHSVGVAAQWLAPLGVFRFSYGIPLNDEEFDETEEFQFSVGSAF